MIHEGTGADSWGSGRGARRKRSMAAGQSPERPASWEGAVRDVLECWHRRGGGPGLVVAVSGGGDSVGLLRAVHRIAPGLGLRPSVAHLDHGARGEAAAEDARFVAGL